jgi:hypothetical protein
MRAILRPQNGGLESLRNRTLFWCSIKQSNKQPKTENDAARPLFVKLSSQSLHVRRLQEGSFLPCGRIVCGRKEDKIAFNVQPDNRPDGIPDGDRFLSNFCPFFIR